MTDSVPIATACYVIAIDEVLQPSMQVCSRDNNYDELKDAASFDVAKILEYLTQQNAHEVTE